ncbi:MAG: CSLREA domain-containing protein [Solirubrobacterales bacterium]|nr:CSLREA domain-containing protein [Solirubrobacterales bacterium]
MKKLLVLMATAVTLLAAAPSAGAVDISVNTTADDYGNPPATCSLREAITSAQTNAAFGGCPAGLGSDSIKLPAGTYKITRAGAEEDANLTGDFDVIGVNALTIEPATASDKVVVDANGIDRAFDQQGANSLAIQGIQVLGGKTTAIGDDGAGIRNSVGTLTLNRVTVSGNTTDYSGGGVAVYNNLSMVNSTVSGSSAKQNGGGLYIQGGATATVKSSTITENTADSNADENGDGGGFYDNASVGVNFFNVIDSANVDSSPTPANKTPDCYSNSTLFFPRYVLSTQPLGPGSCLVGFNPGTNQVVADPKIGPLQDNGGQTPTHALLVGSPAIGAGGTTAPDTCPATDQNGRDRPANSCDIGAVQYFDKPIPPPVDTFGVEISKIKPKLRKLKRGKKAKAVSVKVKSTGTAAATGVKVCVKSGKKARKAIKLKGKSCRKAGTLSASAKVKFKFKAKKRAKKKKYKLKVVVTSSNAAKVKGKIKIKVK